MKRINADKPHLWKADIAASVDQFNDWFVNYAPQAFRSTRARTADKVKAALGATEDLRNLDCKTLMASPGALPTLRMCTAPPLAVDRLVGLAGVGKSLIARMEQGRLPSLMSDARMAEAVGRICAVIARLLDHDIFPWLSAA